MRQCLDNVFTNAINHSPKNAPVSVFISRASKDGQTWGVVQVVDEGPGIPADLVERVFEKFFEIRLPFAEIIVDVNARNFMFFRAFFQFGDFSRHTRSAIHESMMPNRERKRQQDRKSTRNQNYYRKPFADILE